MRVRSRLPNVGTTIFATMTRLAEQHGAINLSQGFPDFNCAPELIELVYRHMQAGHNQYAPMAGLPALRERIASKVRQLYGADYDADAEITVSAGATEALFAAITAVTQPGDEVIVIDPAYDAYAPVIALSQGVPVPVPLKFPEYRIDWDRVSDAITARTRLLILNTPHNPTGSVLTGDDIAALQHLASDSDWLIISDEVYEHIIFDGCKHHSIASYPDLAQKTFVISSFGKTYHTTGWKVGYCLAPPDLTAEFRKMHQFLTFAVNTPVQHAYAEFMENEDAWRSLSGFYQRKRDIFRNAVQESRFGLLPCDGTYFQLLDYSAISEDPDMTFAEWLTREHKVAAIPPSVFYLDGADNRVLRFCFAKRDETLAEAGEVLCGI